MQTATAYKILDLDPGASVSDIKKAYHEKARQIHPDKNFAEDAKEKFQQINEAYQHLLNNNGTELSAETALEYPNYISYLNINGYIDPPGETNIQDILKNYLSTLDLAEKALNKQATNAQPKSPYSSFYADIASKKKFFNTNIPSATLFYTNNFSHLDDVGLAQVIATADSRYQRLNINNNEKLFHERALLWVAQKENCAPVYIFNTIHVGLFDAEDIFGQVLEGILNNVATVFTETALAINDRPISRVLEEKIAHKFNKPVACLDCYISKKAFEMGKKLKALEDTGIRALLGLTFDDNDEKSFELVVENHIKDVSERYLNFGSVDLGTSLSEEKAKDKSAIKRNKFWMLNSMLPESQQQIPSLVVCGETHSHGIWGLPNLLITEGYTVTPLLKNAPKPLSSIFTRQATGMPNFMFFGAPPIKILTVIEDKQASTINPSAKNNNTLALR